MNVIDKVQEALYSALTEDGYDVYDVPELDTPFPFIKMGDSSLILEKDKLNTIRAYNVKQDIHIWNNQGDKIYSNDMVNNIMYLLLELEIDDLKIISQDVINIAYTDYENARQTSMTLEMKIMGV